MTDIKKSNFYIIFKIGIQNTLEKRKFCNKKKSKLLYWL